MGDMLSQDEINALLDGLDETDDNQSGTGSITDDEKDAVGEVSNISMGTAATTLFSLVNQKVVITTPKVTVTNWDEFTTHYTEPSVSIQIEYKDGLVGTNVLILKENDVKVIVDLMMGGDGSKTDEDIGELHLSAIGEAMNQMIGSAATSMSSMFDKKIDILPPKSAQMDLNETFDPEEIASFMSDDFLAVSFQLQIGDLVDSELIQIYPIQFAKDIYQEFTNSQTEEDTSPPPQEPSQQAPQPEAPAQQEAPQQQVPPQQQAPQQGMGMPQQGMSQQGMPQQGMGIPQQGMGMPQQGMGMNPNPVNVQQAQFQNFNMGDIMQQKENIDLIMDVPLEVTVELGRTSRSIKDILEFAPGTIIELNKLSGEPIDVLVNGKIVAKGEVVVIDENFSIRVTDIIKGNNSK